MKRRKKILRMLIKAFRICGAGKIIAGYVVFFFLSAVPVMICEPNISSYADSLWFCFASATSIGYGDIIAVTHIGRIITVILSVYSIAVIAIFTAVITSFFTDIARLKANESTRQFLDDLEHLDEMNKEELKELSERIKSFQK